MTKHTPAPWTTDRGHILDSDRNVLASVPYSLGDAQDHANARLIAAAPELLAVCKDVLRHKATDWNALADLIAKAEAKKERAS